MIYLLLFITLLSSILTYKLSNFFISESTRFEKSGCGIIIVKLIPTLIVAYYVFIFGGRILQNIFGQKLAF
jgi:hypothetical protein